MFFKLRVLRESNPRPEINSLLLDLPAKYPNITLKSVNYTSDHYSDTSYPYKIYVYNQTLACVVHLFYSARGDISF